MKNRKLDQRIELLLADRSYQGHPLHDALGDLWRMYRDQVSRLERIAQVSDSYQAMARDRELDLNERFEKQLRQLTKIARISDRYQDMLREVNAALKEASNHDSLTGLANRRMLMELLRAETERAVRHSQPFVVAMLDVDNFKAINDTQGHDVGDRVLVEIAHTLQGGLREYDVCGRWGGEEFLLLMPQTALDDALMVLDRVLQSVRDLVLGIDNLWVTASIGVTAHRSGDSVQETLKRADDALREAKRLGKDRCVRG